MEVQDSTQSYRCQEDQKKTPLSHKDNNFFITVPGNLVIWRFIAIFNRSHYPRAIRGHRKQIKSDNLQPNKTASVPQRKCVHG